jgi:predicted PurR-regulated permease PerM
VVVFCALLYLLRGMLLPFVVGLMVAYLLNPMVDRLERWRLGRGLGSALVLGVFFAFLTGVLIWLVPLLVEQITGLVRSAPDYLQSLRRIINARLATSSKPIPAVGTLLQANGDKLLEVAVAVLGGLWHSGMVLVGTLSLLFITPLVAFYCLRDWHHIQQHVKDLLPLEHKEVICTQLYKIDQVLSGYLRGQTLVCLIMACYFGFALSLAGLDYGLLIGVIAGLLTFIPYVGSAIGAVTSIGMAIVQFDGVQPVLLVAGLFALGQLFEGNVLTPRIVGERVGLHPVWVIFGMLAGGTLLGMVGVLIALPLSAVVGVLVRFMIERYHRSDLYNQEDS